MEDRVEQPQPVVTGLPRRDVVMTVILLAIMGAADVIAAITGVPRFALPFFVIMPGTLAVIWACYAASVAITLRRSKGNLRPIGKMGVFMGRTLSLMGAVLTVFHIGLLGVFAGWLHDLRAEILVRSFMVAFSVVLVLMYNQMPKLIASCQSAGDVIMSRGNRLAGWAGVLCGMAMIVIALVLPMQRMTPVFLSLAFLPTLIILANTGVWWLDRRRAERS